MKAFTVACPTCKKKFIYQDSAFRPFCCEQCRLIDLGQWLSESYGVPAQKLDEEELKHLEEIHVDKKWGNDAEDTNE
jgi:uncharacterized protein